MHTFGSHIRALSNAAISDFHSSQPISGFDAPSHSSKSSCSSTNASFISGNFFLPPARFFTTSFPRTNDMRIFKYDFHSLNESGNCTRGDS
jgi:hypothetical protein